MGDATCVLRSGTTESSARFLRDAPRRLGPFSSMLSSVQPTGVPTRPLSLKFRGKRGIARLPESRVRIYTRAPSWPRRRVVSK